MAYRFSVLRFVPDSGRGEFVNIGAVRNRGVEVEAYAATELSVKFYDLEHA